MPKIDILEPIYDELADELVHVYEPGVFELIPTTSSDPKHTSRKVRVINPYACTMSRNYLRHPILAKSLAMSRIPDHFIFSVESVGMYKPGVLVAEALRVLQSKCQRVMDLVDERANKMEE
jgi:DNA-directed RNA polymerase alpha subunit